MFVGHLGVGLALKRVEPGASLGLLFAAVLLLDGLLGVFVLLGLEQVIVPPDYARLHYLRFVFPFSHGLVASLVWSGLAFLVVAAWRGGGARRGRIAAVTALAVFSHFVCDAIEHPPELPVAGAGSPGLGLGLWNHLGLALGLEGALVVIGLVLYLPTRWGSTTDQGRRQCFVLVAVMLLLSALAFAGQAASPTPPSTAANIVAWLAQPVVFGAFGFWVDRSSGTGRTKRWA